MVRTGFRVRRTALCHQGDRTGAAHLVQRVPPLQTKGDKGWQ